MNDSVKKTGISYDGEEIDFSDIPEITDFSKAIKNPFYGKYIKDGKYTVIIEHSGFDEVAEYEIKTGKKTVLQLIIKDSRILVEDQRQGNANVEEENQSKKSANAARVGV